MSIYPIIKKHGLALAAAAIFAALVVLPTIRSLSGVPAQGDQIIYPTFNKDEIHYQAMTEEAAEGHYGLGNTYLYEHKDKPGMQAPLAEIFIAAEAKLFGQPIPAIFAANDFFVSFINFILLYLFFYLLAGKRGIALIFAFLFFAFFLYSFGRAINPQFSFMFFALGLILIYKTYESCYHK
ncbi:MAG: hypothetical protein MUC28_03590, partial [Planctomycetes bacterium]|nr:hypothetical protein [Planctomycetota bacterium]